MLRHVSCIHSIDKNIGYEQVFKIFVVGCKPQISRFFSRASILGNPRWIIVMIFLSLTITIFTLELFLAI